MTTYKQKTKQLEYKGKYFKSRSELVQHIKDNPAKPRSALQIANQQAQWAIHYSLQGFNICSIRDVMPSQETGTLAYERDELTKKLKLSIQKDYDNYKAKLIAFREELTYE